MKYIHIANIACGGHAGNAESVAVFRELAVTNHVLAAAHLSYPDPQNFGRKTMVISVPRLIESLEEQLSLMEDITLVKFHGALYNNACDQVSLAEALADWLKTRSIQSIITLKNSALDHACTMRGIRVLSEMFAERWYTYSPKTGRLSLVNREKENACILNCEEAVRQVRNIVQNNQVEAFIENDGENRETQMVKTRADTLCIHSDSAISLELAKQLFHINQWSQNG